MSNIITSLTSFLVFSFLSLKSVLLLIFGAMIAVISGYVEYLALSSLFPEYDFILELVVAVEGTKVIFVIKKGIGKSSNQNFFVNLIHSSFVILSIYCATLICFNEMSNPRANEYLDKALAISLEEYEREINEINADGEKQLQILTQENEDRLDTLYKLKELEKLNVQNGTFIGERFIYLEKEIAKVSKENKEIRLSHNDALLEQKLAAKSNRKIRDSLIIEKSKDQRITGPEMLVSSLTIINGTDQFDVLQIQLNIFFISLLMVLIMEGVIFVTFFSVGEEYGKAHEEKKEQVAQNTFFENLQATLENIRKTRVKVRDSEAVLKLEKLFEKFAKACDSAVSKIKNVITN